jgi:hypothetical protein
MGFSDARLAKLTGGVAIVHVGAATETAMKEKKDRVDDALNATYQAAQSPPGGLWCAPGTVPSGYYLSSAACPSACGTTCSRRGGSGGTICRVPLRHACGSGRRCRPHGQSAARAASVVVLFGATASPHDCSG